MSEVKRAGYVSLRVAISIARQRKQSDGAHRYVYSIDSEDDERVKYYIVLKDDAYDESDEGIAFEAALEWATTEDCRSH